MSVFHIVSWLFSSRVLESNPQIYLLYYTYCYVNYISFFSMNPNPYSDSMPLQSMTLSPDHPDFVSLSWAPSVSNVTGWTIGSRMLVSYAGRWYYNEWIEWWMAGNKGPLLHKNTEELVFSFAALLHRHSIFLMCLISTWVPTI